MTYLPQNKLSEWREANKPSRCPILNDRQSDWVVDHDHRTGMVRGVISRVGNSLIGKIENYLVSRGGQKQEDFPKILRNIANYLESKNTDILHPVGLTQLTKRFSNNLTSDDQYAVLRDLGGDNESIQACKNAQQRKKLFRKLTKQKYNH